MIDTIAMVLSIVGTPLIAMKSDKARLVGFSAWFVGNLLWLQHWWVLGELPAFVIFVWYQIWCVFGILGCYGAIKRSRSPPLLDRVHPEQPRVY